MKLALYSTLAREYHGVQAARAHIQRQGLRPIPSHMRRMRKYIASGEGGKGANGAKEDQARLQRLQLGDFSSLSEVRDLMFHSHEVSYTLPELSALLDRHSLEFLGFDVAPRARQLYTQAFPADTNLTSLDAWHAFERRNPGLFGSMYQFWVRQR